MIPTPSYLQNTEAVLKAFGYWPSFHDAPVLGFNYVEGGGGAIAFTLHGMEMTRQVDDHGYLKLIKHHLVRFAFHEISEADLQQFALSNTLFEMGFSSPAEFEAVGKFRVMLESALGGDLSGSFSARTGEVLEVAPCDEKGHKT